MNLNIYENYRTVSEVLFQRILFPPLISPSQKKKKKSAEWRNTSSYRYVNSNLHTAINVLKNVFFFCCCSSIYTFFFSFYPAISLDTNDSDFRPPCELQFKIRQNAQLKKNNNKTKRKINFALWQRRGTASREKNTYTHPLFRKESVTKPRTIKGAGWGRRGAINERIHREDYTNSHIE